ncbi:Fanconi anemia group J protein-like protein [Dichanthelium oligosanthes]|uniref:Fanconi anemia group J protein-like protein n=1 Tax=Dichanthelium oligosanthes TaxID=888268 RepID=A0A1E5ULI1_9POAL|nr:Fanconi anemia group J protein-like protein [Dichanthelium oligosanthes]
MGGASADADDFASPPSSAPPAPRARADGGVYQVGGVPVEFPYKPYGTQLAFMGRVIATLDRARRQGQSHALLESPTGTGKSLSLLCSALAWQRHYPLRTPPAAPAPALDPFLHGGGFVADDTQPQATPVIPEKAAKKKNAPTIYYATRTHAQITQVVREYRKTSYRVRMAILASRKHYCVNKLACMSDNIDEQCKLLLDDNVQGGACSEFKNAQKLSRHPSLQIGGCYEVHDIEDLVRVGRKVKGCPYFAAQHMAETAQLVFCPYNYLISPIVRRAMDIDIGGSIIILDEAHWTGEKAMKELQLAGINPMCFPILQECATKAVKAASDTESDGSHLNGGHAMTLESLFSSLSYFFANNGRNVCDYQLALQRFVKKEGKEISSKCTMSLWCLNPAVVFREIADLTLSVILTSGTLSPMGSFASELGVQFEACLEAPHVINVDSQVFAAVLSSGPTRHKLNASYKTADNSSFQDELGASLEEICRIVPGGALVFFPSYKLLDKLQVRWSQTGQWTRLNAQKHMFVEPKGSTEELEPVLKGYYDAILGKAPVKKGRSGAKQIVKNRLTKNSSQESAKTGAALLAVCRGKVSEGIDFSDDNARVVMSDIRKTGISFTFPNGLGMQSSSMEKIKIKDRDMFPKIKLESEALSSLSDKRKLPWPELSSSNHSAQQKNQKVKTECLSQKVPNIDGVAIDQKKGGMSYMLPEVSKISSRSSLLVKKEISPTPDSPPMAHQLPAWKVQSDFEGVADTGANYEVKTEAISLEEDDFKPWYKMTILNPLEGRSHRPTPVEETSPEAPVASPSNYSEVNISVGINNGNLSCLSTSVATPERTTYRECHESLINKSVNSLCEKKRRLSSPMSSCTYSEHSDSPSKSHCRTHYDVTLVHRDLNRNAELCCKNMSMSRCENVKLERNYRAEEVSEKAPTQLKLLISCIRCKTALGLEQDGLLVACSQSSSSKFYLAHLLRHGLSTVGFPEDGFSASTPAEIQVVECDASSLNQNIFGKFSHQGSCHHSGVWSAKDGCVYKAVICPFCSSENACAMILGVQVLATDKPNQQLVEKVLLFSERLDVKPEPSKGQASKTRRDGSNSISLPPVIDLESFAYKPLKKNPVPLNSRRAKVRLFLILHQDSKTSESITDNTSVFLPLNFLWSS